MINLLTPKQEAFCLKYVELGNASEAFRASYNVGEDTKPSSVNNMAWRLLQKVEIRERLKVINEENQAKMEITLRSLTEDIQQAERFAYKMESPSSLINGIALKAKLHGLLVDHSKQKVEVAVNRDLRTLMAKIDGQSRTLQKRPQND